MKNDDAPDARGATGATGPALSPAKGPAGPAEAVLPAEPFRLRASRAVLGTAAGCLLVVAILHAGGYAVASIAVANSGLKPEYQAMFRGLWLGFSLQSLVVAAILGLATLRPSAVSRPALVLCGLLPLVGGAMVAWSLASPVASVLLVAATLLVVAGTLLLPSASKVCAAAVLSLLALSAGCGGKVESWSFETRTAAEADPAARPRIPAWLPAGAAQIRLAHDPSAARTWVRFSLAGTEREALKARLIPVPGDQSATLTIPEPPGVDWWFASPRAAGADFFDGNGKDVPARAHLAFAKAGDAVWGWELK